MDSSGNMADRADIATARRYPARWPRGLHPWAYDYREPRTVLGLASTIIGKPICVLDDGAIIWRLGAKDKRFKHSLGLSLPHDAERARDGAEVVLFHLDDLDQIEWARARAAGRCKG